MHNPIAMHKQVEQTLRCLIKTAEQANEGIAIAAIDGTIRFVNTAWSAMHGYNTPQELIGKNINIFHTDEQMKADVIACIDETKNRGQLEGIIGHVRKDGTAFLTDMKMTLVTDDNSDPIALIVFATDITKLKQAEDELRRQCQRLERQAEELIRQLATSNKRLQSEIALRTKSEEKLLESIIEADEPAGPIPTPFNPQELKALSELAKRLA